MKNGELACLLFNTSWAFINLGRYKRFLAATRTVKTVQEKYLLKLVRKNNHTLYGDQHGFEGIVSVGDFRERIPLSRYEDYYPYIEAISRGEQNILTGDPVVLFEPSSGTSAPTKLIPYTRTLKAEFQRAIAPWMVTLFFRYPALLGGMAYWSISPSIEGVRFSGRVPVGFDDDSAYLGFLGKWAYSRVTAVRMEEIAGFEGDEFKNRTLAHLLLAENLRFISIWSPTFLYLLLDHLLGNYGEVLAVMKSLPHPGTRSRANSLRKIFSSESSTEIFRRIWPKLHCVSCWSDGLNSLYAEKLSSYLPGVSIQPKGLITTEAFVSLPFVAGKDPVLAVNSHFFEFIEQHGEGVYLAHELIKGRRYSVVVTTSGGLYRYHLEDVVEITGFVNDAPTFRFIAKEGLVSDRCGEKLNAYHVQNSAYAVFNSHGIKPSFFMIAPSEQAEEIAYTLFIDSPLIRVEQAASLAVEFDAMLSENFHYQHCRRTGQLGRVRVFIIDSSKCSAEGVFVDEQRQRGRKLGDIKPLPLDTQTGWERCFKGGFVS